MSNFNRQIKGVQNTRKAQCSSVAIQKILKEEAKLAVPLPTESVVDVYMKTRDETNPENHNLQMLERELYELLERAYPDIQEMEVRQMAGPITNVQLAEIGATRPGMAYPQYRTYHGNKYDVVNYAKIRERMYIEEKRWQWIDDQMMPRMKKCMDAIDMNIPLTNIITASPNTHNANLQRRTNASIAKHMENMGNLFRQTPAANSTGGAAPRTPIHISHKKGKAAQTKQTGGSRNTTRKHTSRKQRKQSRRRT